MVMRTSHFCACLFLQHLKTLADFPYEVGLVVTPHGRGRVFVGRSQILKVYSSHLALSHETFNLEPGARSQEPGARSQEPGARRITPRLGGSEAMHKIFNLTPTVSSRRQARSLDLYAKHGVGKGPQSTHVPRVRDCCTPEPLDSHARQLVPVG